MREICLLVLLLASCRPGGSATLPFGAPCASDAECGSGRWFCATDHPGGYCVAECRADDECQNGACVRPDPASEGQCHATCKSDGDCRAGYICKLTSVDATRAYCDPPGHRHILRRLRSTWWR